MSNTKGGLTKGFNTSPHYEIPCTQVLSVAGFFDIPGLFLLGFGFIPELKDLPDIPTFLTFLTFLNSYFRYQGGLLTPVLTMGGTMVGIIPVLTMGGTLVGIHLSSHPWETPWWVLLLFPHPWEAPWWVLLLSSPMGGTLVVFNLFLHPWDAPW